MGSEDSLTTGTNYLMRSFFVVRFATMTTKNNPRSKTVVAHHLAKPGLYFRPDGCSIDPNNRPAAIAFIKCPFIVMTTSKINYCHCSTPSLKYNTDVSFGYHILFKNRCQVSAKAFLKQASCLVETVLHTLEACSIRVYKANRITYSQ